MVFGELKRLIDVRRQHRAFDPYGDFEVLELGAEVFAIRRRSMDGGETVDCVANLTNNRIKIAGDFVGRDLLSNEPVDHTTDLEPFAIRWIQCKNAT